jgi:hypothetical protein
LDPRAKDIKHGPTPKSFDPNSVDTSSNPTQNPTWYAPNATPSSGAKVITQAQLNEAAQQAGKSVSEMREWAKKRGYQIQ